MRTGTFTSAIVLLFAGIIAGGCESTATSPFVGRWHAPEMPEPVGGGIEQAQLLMEEDGTFSVILQNAEGREVAGFGGIWNAVDEDEVHYRAAEGPGEGQGRLVDPRTLVTTGNGLSVHFHKTDD